MKFLLVLPLVWAFLASAPSAQENIQNDYDGDGIVNSRDACPLIPAANDGIDEAVFCSPKLREVIDRYVFLWSRTFQLPKGIEPSLTKLGEGEFHALLHVQPDKSRKTISAEQRKAIEGLGVKLLGYLPHRTYYARFPSQKALQTAGELKHVFGISAIRPEDRLDPFLRIEKGPVEGRNEDGTYTVSVTFFGEKISPEMRADLKRIRAEVIVADGSEAHVRVNGDDGLAALALMDTVITIADIAGPPAVKTGNGRTLVGLDPVDTNFNLFGSGLSIAIAEVGVIPVGHPDLEPRVQRLAFWPLGQGLASVLLPDAQTLNDIALGFAGGPHAQFVGSIIAGSGATLPGNRGLLPMVELLSYSVIAPLHKQRFYRIGQDARISFDAMALNYSVGPENLNRPGAYLNRGRWLDRAVRWHSIPIIWAAGNERCASANPCLDLVPSLPHPVAKNDISVGNFSLTTGQISSTSSAGPAADGRLKPDLTAPGGGIATVNFNPLTTNFQADTFSGTSAAAPFVTGLVGILTERFIRDGRPLDTILPALIKAILVETADDFGAPGPDFSRGYGIVNASEAVRLVQDPARIFEGAIQETDGPLSFTLTVDQPRPDLSATLVWTDIPGQTAGTLSLINDLDLQVRDPSGNLFLPFDLSSPPSTPGALELGTQPCTSTACIDILNNVEQAFVDTGGLLELGDWTITVVPTRVQPIFPNVPRQDFSIAVSAKCPVIIRRDTVLTGDIACPADRLAPEIVKVTAGAELDCDGFSITGSGFQVGGVPGQIGIDVLSSNSTISNCTVEQVPVGIRVEPGATGVVLLDNSVNDTRTAGIELLGAQATVRENTIRRVHGGGAAAVLVRAGSVQIENNNIFPFPSTPGAPATEIGVLWASQADAGFGPGFIRSNSINGANFGVVVDAGTVMIDGLDIWDNSFEGTQHTAITVAGVTNRTRIRNNTVQAFGANGHGIVIRSGQGHEITGNEIVAGPPSQNSKTCIHARQIEGSVISGNRMRACGIGLQGFRNSATLITENTVESIIPGAGIRARVGISSTSSKAPDGLEHIARNSVQQAQTGIAIAGETDARLSENAVSEVETGIVLRATSGSQISVVGGQIEARRLGLMLTGGRAAIEGISFSSAVPSGTPPGHGIGIGDPNCDDVSGTSIKGNVLSALDRALAISCDAPGLSIIENDFSQNRVAISHDSSASLSSIELQGNTFIQNMAHALFETPVVGTENRWDDILTLQIFDSDGDGFGDCGSDYPYTSQAFSGGSTAGNVSSLSTEVQDTRPVTSAQGNC